MPTENEREKVDTAYKLMFEEMSPSVRECDPCAYFRAKLAGLQQARESVLVEEEYSEERDRILDMIVSPAQYPPLMFPLLVTAITAGIAASLYATAVSNWGLMTGSLAATGVAIWLLAGHRKHRAWLEAISQPQRAKIVEYLRESDLIDEGEADVLRSRLETEFADAGGIQQSVHETHPNTRGGDTK